MQYHCSCGLVGLFVTIASGTSAFSWAADPYLLKEINPSGSAMVVDLVRVQFVIFFQADNGVTGRALWQSDGTEARIYVLPQPEPALEAVYDSDLVLRARARLLRSGNGGP